MNCKQLVELVTDYLEGALSEEDTRRFESHLAGCAGCTRYVEQIRQTIRTTQNLSKDELSQSVPQELLDVFRSWKE